MWMCVDVRVYSVCKTVCERTHHKFFFFFNRKKLNERKITLHYWQLTGYINISIYYSQCTMEIAVVVFFSSFKCYFRFADAFALALAVIFSLFLSYWLKYSVICRCRWWCRSAATVPLPLLPTLMLLLPQLYLWFYLILFYLINSHFAYLASILALSLYLSSGRPKSICSAQNTKK